MTDNNHTITPPPELVEQWECEYHHMTYGPDLSMFISEKAARWGADRELQLCLDWFQEFYKGETWVDKDLRAFMAARRPKRLKEQVLKMLDPVHEGISIQLTSDEQKLIVKALESLPE